MKIVVTGATGFIGSNLVPALLADGHSVWSIRRASSNTEKVPQCEQWISYDGRLESLSEPFLLIRPDVVIHLASLFIAEHKPAEVTPLVESNILFPAHLLEAMDLSGCRHLLNTGTLWQHFDNEDYNPTCLYAATKQAFQDLCRFYVEAKAMRAIHLQLSDSYGPRDPRRKLISILKNALATGAPLAMSLGEQTIDLVHIQDVIEAYRVALKRLPSVKGEEVYSVCTRRPLRLKDLAQLIEKTTGQALLIEWGGRPYRAREVMTPWTVGKTLPDWQPRVSLEDGLKEVLRG